MQSHLLLMRRVLADAGTRCCTSTSRDLTTITARVKEEGLSFLTITLPTFCDGLQRALADGQVDSTHFPSFGKRGCLPRIFSGFTSQIFDAGTGTLLDVPNVDAIQALRQITLLFGKIEYPCSDARVKAAISKYVECEQQVKANDARLHPATMAEFRSMSIRLWEKLFMQFERSICMGEIIPKHGPGSTADGLLGNEKYNQTYWTERLEREGLYAGTFLFPSWSHYLSDSSSITWLDPGAEVPVKVITVPKTLKTPRIIAIEPTCMQFVQQGLMEMFVKGIERSDSLSTFIGFSDQGPNRAMALEGSSTGTLATLDLSEASDRVSNQLVRNLFAYFRNLRDAVEACRSRKADVPGFGVLRLAKFASMGSALTFPIEAMVFLTIIFIGIERERSVPLSEKDIASFIGKVRVYGDDIVVPVEYVRSVITALTDFGLVVNRKKSFWTGKFRESCGKEFFDGTDVSVVRVRRDIPTSRRHVQELISTVSLRNQMYFSGYWITARYLDEILERLIPFPVVLPGSPALGRHSFLGYESERECRYLQRPLVRAYVEHSLAPKSHLEGYGALLKYFLKRSAEPSADRKHLERAGRPQVVGIKLGWVSAT